MRIDLDAARAARSEQDGDPHQVLFKGKELSLPAKMPIGVAIAAAKGDIEGLLRVLFGEQYDQFIGSQPDQADLEVLAAGLGEVYGVGLGEAEASAVSS